MNKIDSDILLTLAKEGPCSQRELAKHCGCSLGAVNSGLRNLQMLGYLDKNCDLTQQAYQLMNATKPQRAIILAAGFGMRIVPINLDTPKAFLKVHGEYLVERLIRQLHEAGIRDIYIVVGFMKELFEPLIDEYGVELIVNSQFSQKNNLHSLALASEHLENTYIIPGDLWCQKNPFRRQELYTWYMVNDTFSNSSTVRLNRKQELVQSIGGNTMLGICYLAGNSGIALGNKLKRMVKDPRFDNTFWESALFDGKDCSIAGRLVESTDVKDVNTYEQLREIDSSSEQLENDAITAITQSLNVAVEEIEDIAVLKKGMTNRSFLFSCRNKQYIMRIPGEGTDLLINRPQEASVYNVIQNRNICDDVVYINPDNGYKITKFWDGARVCNPNNLQDLEVCMEALRSLHSQNLKVEHTFDIFAMICFYESLWGGTPSRYRDYSKTKENVFRLQDYISTHAEPYCLTHIDAVPDNFLLIPSSEGGERVRLIDWEYSGMQDPHVDIAMFCIYSLYKRNQVDKLIDIYFQGKCTEQTRMKIYCYIAACGLLWSNWCEYKSHFGVEFGEYSLRQYRYAKDYYRIVAEQLEKKE